MSTLEQAITHLIENERFWAEMVIRMKRNITCDIPTLGVSYDQDGVILHVNPYFIQNLSIQETASVLKHECEHVGNDHIERESYIVPDFNRNKINESPTFEDMFEKMKTADILNIAEDIAINQHINNLPEKFTIFDKEGNPVLDEKQTIVDDTGTEVPNPNFNKPAECSAWTVDSLIELLKKNKVKQKVKRDMPFEYYYNILKQNEEELKDSLPKSPKILVTLDNHDLKDHQKDSKAITDPELQKEIAKKLLKDSKESAEQKSAGCTPAHIDLLIEALQKVPKDWKKDLRKFVAKHTNSLKEVSRNYRNRRQRLGDPLVPGFRPKTKTNIAALFDVSGSMCDSQLEQIVAEFDKLHSMGVEIVVIQFDTEVRSIEKYKSAKIKINGRGGTCFNPPLRKTVDKDFTREYNNLDGIIFFTDGDAWEDKIFKPKVPVLWALNEGCTPPVNWGWKTEVKINAKKK